MIVSGVVVNRTGKYKHIFKRNVGPNQRVKLEDLYKLYEAKCACDFDEKFLAWLKENKIPATGWEILDLKTRMDKPVKVVSSKLEIEQEQEDTSVTARTISNLRVKDKPKQVIDTIDNIYKLRRALTYVNKKKGKAFLAKLIKNRIDKLQEEQGQDEEKC